jgi:hypothetical protein
MSDPTNTPANEPANEPQIKLDAPEIQEAIRKAVDSEVSGLKNKNQELLGKLKDYSERAKAIDALGGEDGIKQLMEMRQRLEQDEDLKLFATGKREEYNERITRRAKADLQKQLEARDKVIEESQQKAKTLEQKLQRQVVTEQVRQAAAKAELFHGAVEDALLHASNVFSLDENGNLIARNADGELETGKDGKTLTIGEWLESMRESRPHWWPAQSGMGTKAGGNNGTQRGPKSYSEAKTIDEKRAFLANKYKLETTQ